MVRLQISLIQPMLIQDGSVLEFQRIPKITASKLLHSWEKRWDSKLSELFQRTLDSRVTSEGQIAWYWGTFVHGIFLC